MPKRFFLTSCLIALSWLGGVHAAIAQNYVPHVVQPNPAELEELGLDLAQQAAQFAQLQQYEIALPRASLASQLAPKRAEVWSLLGGLYIQLNQVDEGITALKRANGIDAQNTAVLFALGSAHFQQGKYQEAVNYLKSGLKIKPDVPGALFDLGNAYLMLKQYSEAIAQFERAYTKDKEFWPAVNNVGLIRYEQGNLNEALRQWQLAADIDKKAAEPRLALAVGLYTRGERERGLKLGEEAIRLDSRYSDLKFLKENLWGDRLLADAKKFLETPTMRATIAQSQGQEQTP